MTDHHHCPSISIPQEETTVDLPPVETLYHVPTYVKTPDGVSIHLKAATPPTPPADIPQDLEDRMRIDRMPRTSLLAIIAACTEELLFRDTIVKPDDLGGPSDYHHEEVSLPNRDHANNLLRLADLWDRG